MKEYQIIIEQTPKTPLIDLNQMKGDLIFYGKSIPENAAKLYEPVLNWVTEYVLNPKQTTNLRLNLEYFNTSSVLWLAKIFKTLIRINEPDFVLIVHLYLSIEDYDEISDFEDIKETFGPIEDIVHGAIPSVGIKVYGTNEKDEIIKETLIFV